MWQTVLISFINVLVSVLEAAFAKKSFDPRREEDFFNRSSNDGGNQSSYGESSSDAGDDFKLREAYRFMELEHPVTIEQVRKQWKRLSLRYHPDRNSGSDNSHELQQKLNRSYELIRDSLEGRTPISEPESDDPSEQPDQQEPEAPEEEHEKPEPKRQTKKQKRRERRRREKEEQEKRQREMEAERKRMRQEMKEEARKLKEWKQNLEREKNIIRASTSRLVDWEQRQAANEFFMNQVRVHKEDRQQRQRDGREQSYSQNYEKPKHYVMESCTSDLAVAMRLGKDDYAIILLEEQVNGLMNHQINDFYVMSRLILQYGETQAIDALVQITVIKVLSQSLDEDGNTPLHYAVYWERPLLIQSLCGMANQHGLLNSLLMHKNKHGYTAIDIGAITKDPAVWSYLQSYEALINIYVERTQVLPALQKARNTLVGSNGLLKNIDLVTTANTVLGYLVGRYGFQLHYAVTILTVMLLQALESLSEENAGPKLLAPGRNFDVATLVGLFTIASLATMATEQIWRLGAMWVSILTMYSCLFLYCFVSFVVESLIQILGFLVTVFSVPFEILERRLLGLKTGVFRHRPGLIQTAALLSVLTALVIVQKSLF